MGIDSMDYHMCIVLHAYCSPDPPDWLTLEMDDA